MARIAQETIQRVLDEIDIISSTFGKALGGASGGFISASKNIVDTLRQKSRPYLFSNSLAPALVVACLKALEIINNNKNLITKLHDNTLYFREEIKEIGYEENFDIQRLSKMALEDPSTSSNPKKLTVDDMKIMYQHSMSGKLF